jgi:hypothetical protein
MATTETIVNGTGSNRILDFSFAYLKIEDVKVELQKFKVSTSKVKATVTPAFTEVPNQPTQVQLTAISPATDYQNTDGSLKQYFGDGSDTDFIVRARIYRLTGTDATPATFVNGTSIRAKDLNDNFDQFLFTMQERQNQIDNIETGVIADGAVDTAELADDAVTADKLSDSESNDGLRAVTTNHIRDGAVTSAKLGNNITVANNLTVSNNLNVTNASTFSENINIDQQSDGTDSKLKFRDKDGGNQAQLYVNTSGQDDLHLELRDGASDFKIYKGDSTLLFTFGFNGDLTLHGATSDVTASQFYGDLIGDVTGNVDGNVEGNLTGTADKSDSVKRNEFTAANSWKDVAAWNGTGNNYNELANSTGGGSDGVQINGEGKLKAQGDVETSGTFLGNLQQVKVRNAIAEGDEGQNGTYAFCTLVQNTGDQAAGNLAPGSNLRYSNADATANGTPSGTWRLMGRLAGNPSDSSTRETSLWLRIS